MAKATETATTVKAATARLVFLVLASNLPHWEALFLVPSSPSASPTTALFLSALEGAPPKVNFPFPINTANSKPFAPKSLRFLSSQPDGVDSHQGLVVSSRATVLVDGCCCCWPVLAISIAAICFRTLSRKPYFVALVFPGLVNSQKCIPTAVPSASDVVRLPFLSRPRGNRQGPGSIRHSAVANVLRPNGHEEILLSQSRRIGAISDCLDLVANRISSWGLLRDSIHGSTSCTFNIAPAPPFSVAERDRLWRQERWQSRIFSYARRDPESCTEIADCGTQRSTPENDCITAGTEGRCIPRDAVGVVLLLRHSH